MIRDAQATYSYKQAITALGNTDSTNTIDQIATGDAYNPVFIVAQVSTAFASGGAGTLAVNLITADDAAFTVNVTTTQIVGAQALAALSKGAVLFKGQLPQGERRYRKLQYVVGTAAMTAGNITAFETLDVQTNRMN